MTDDKTEVEKPKKKREAKRLFLFEMDSNNASSGFTLNGSTNRWYGTERRAYKAVEAMGDEAKGKTFVLARMGKPFSVDVETVTKTTINRT